MVLGGAGTESLVYKTSTRTSLKDAHGIDYEAILSDEVDMGRVKEKSSETYNL